VTIRFTGRRNVSLDGLFAAPSEGREESGEGVGLANPLASRTGRFDGRVGGSFRPHAFAGFDPHSEIPPPPRFNEILCSASTRSLAD